VLLAPSAAARATLHDRTRRAGSWRWRAADVVEGRGAVGSPRRRRRSSSTSATPPRPISSPRCGRPSAHLITDAVQQHPPSCTRNPVTVVAEHQTSSSPRSSRRHGAFFGVPPPRHRVRICGCYTSGTGLLGCEEAGQVSRPDPKSVWNAPGRRHRPGDRAEDDRSDRRLHARCSSASAGHDQRGHAP
jgi:hypothetical protein